MSTPITIMPVPAFSLPNSALVGRGTAGNGPPEQVTLGPSLAIGSDGALAMLVNTASIAFTDGDTLRRVTITNASVLSTSKIVGTIRRPNTTDDSADAGYIYIANVVKVSAGSFDLLVACLAWGFDDPVLYPPNETVTFAYSIA